MTYAPRIGRYSRKEILGIIAARHGQPEGVGEGSMFEFHFRISPEALDAVMGARIVAPDGSESRLEGFELYADGFVEPCLKKLEPADVR